MVLLKQRHVIYETPSDNMVLPSVENIVEESKKSSVLVGLNGRHGIDDIIGIVRSMYVVNNKLCIDVDLDIKESEYFEYKSVKFTLAGLIDKYYCSICGKDYFNEECTHNLDCKIVCKRITDLWIDMSVIK